MGGLNSLNKSISAETAYNFVQVAVPYPGGGEGAMSGASMWGSGASYVTLCYVQYH